MKQQMVGFEGVVEGRSNALAVAIAKQIVKGPVCKRSNPFVIEGASGYGKTAILNAIALGVEAMHDGRTVYYASGDQFISEYCESLRRNEGKSFLERYETVDVLLLDQTAVLGKSDAIVDLLLQILDVRLRNKRQTVVASGVKFDGIGGKVHMSEVVGRLMAGVVVKIGRPDRRMRITAIKRELQDAGEVLPEAVVEAIADAGKTNMWVVGGILHRVMFASEVSGKTALKPKNLKKLLEN